MPDLPSNRAKKRLVADGVRRLLDTPGWNPHDFVAGKAAERGVTDSGANRALDDAAHCEACEATRRASGDPEALCERHLAAMLGF
jgi:hypothetical protein